MDFILQLILSICENDQICFDKVNKCLDRKNWEYLDNSVNPDIPYQLQLDFLEECKEKTGFTSDQSFEFFCIGDK